CEVVVVLSCLFIIFIFFFQAEDGIRDFHVTGVQTCALPIYGILGDFGVSSHEIDVAERGFSTRFEADLDMRMNRDSNFSAYTVVNKYEESQLRNVLSNYGELRSAAGMARVIVEARENEKIKTSEQLKKVLSRFLPAHKENKILAQIYQAI